MNNCFWLTDLIWTVFFDWQNLLIIMQKGKLKNVYFTFFSYMHFLYTKVIVHLVVLLRLSKKINLGDSKCVFLSYIWRRILRCHVFWCSHQRCSIKKAILKNFAIFTGKHLCWGLFIINLQTFMASTLFKKHSNTGVLLSILWCFEEHLPTAASVYLFT